MNVTLAGCYVVKNTAAANKLVAKAAAGNLTMMVGTSVGPAQYIMLFDAVAAPANATSTAIARFPVPDGSVTPQAFSLAISFGIPFTTGIVVANSTTLATYTAGSADCYFTAVLQ